MKITFGNVSSFETDGLDADEIVVEMMRLTYEMLGWTLSPQDAETLKRMAAPQLPLRRT